MQFIKDTADDYDSKTKPERIQTLKDVSDGCLITETGIITLDSVGDLSTDSESGDQYHIRNFQFDKEFASVPSVGISIVGAHTGNDGFWVKAHVTSVKKDYFKVKFESFKGVNVYKIQISYIATISKISGMDK